MTSVLTLGIIVFAISSIIFMIKPKEVFNSPFLVSFVTLISYIIMIQGNYVVDDKYWTRWVFYGISCPLLAYEMSKQAGLETPKRIFSIFLTAIVMFTGALASISIGDYKLIFFGLSTIAFAYMLYELYRTKAEILKMFSWYIVLGWCLFPLVFVFSNEGFMNIISLQSAATIYLIADIFTKIIFYIQLKNTKILN
jgi:bacteriorhodopsin